MTFTEDKPFKLHDQGLLNVKVWIEGGYQLDISDLIHFFRIGVLGVSILPLSTILIFDFGIVPTCGIFSIIQ